MATLNFKGKSAVWNHHLSVPYHTLEKDAKKSLKGENDSENLIIEGDNLLALKALLPQYQGKVKCIYIDPPYNTGEEGWVYNDNVSSPTIREWMGNVVGKEGDDLTRHDKWLCMMTPRIKLLREMLSDSGVIFVSIDDNEVHDLRCLMDEVFGGKNFVGNIIWQSRTSISNDKEISLNHNHTLVYSRDRSHLVFRGVRLDKSEYSNPDDDPRGLWKGVPLDANKPGGKTKYGIKNPKTGEIYYPPNNRSWSINEEDYLLLLKDGRIAFGKSGDAAPKKKLYWNERLEKDDTKTPSSLLLDVGTTKDGTKEIVELFGGEFFDYPKPSAMVKRLIDFGSEKDSIILDSFSGSGTTAQAVLDLNKEDGGTRKFILVQMPEEIEKDKPAYNAGYRWVHEVTCERVKRVIEKKGYSNGFIYYTLGPAVDAETLLSGDLPSYKEFSKYVYYLVSGKNYSEEKKINEQTYFVGKIDDGSVYLVYQQDMDALKKLAITLDWAQKTHEKDNGKKIVYAPACYLDDEALEQYNIKFVSIPYNLFERNI